MPCVLAIPYRARARMSAPALCRPFEVAGQVGPGQAGRQRLAGGELRLAQAVAGRGAVGPLGILAQVRLEVRDGAGVVARLLAGAGHRQQQPARRASPLASDRAWASSAWAPSGSGGTAAGPATGGVGEPAVDRGEAVLAAAVEQRLGLGAGQRLRRGELPAAISTAASSERAFAAHRPRGSALRAAERTSRAASSRPRAAGPRPERPRGRPSSRRRSSAARPGPRAPCRRRRSGPPAWPRRSPPAARAWPARRPGGPGRAWASGSADPAMGPSPITGGEHQQRDRSADEGMSHGDLLRWRVRWGPGRGILNCASLGLGRKGWDLRAPTIGRATVTAVISRDDPWRTSRGQPSRPRLTPHHGDDAPLL